jgi:uncharacterized membrane protein YtjA (UPF0391 family)
LVIFVVPFARRNVTDNASQEKGFPLSSRISLGSRAQLGGGGPRHASACTEKWDIRAARQEPKSSGGARAAEPVGTRICALRYLGKSDQPRNAANDLKSQVMVMLRWAVIFLLISLVAGGLGFTGISAAAGRISKLLFVIFGVLFLLVVLVAYLIGEAVF